MGDRTYCQLRLIGEAPQELLDVIEYELGPEDDYEGTFGIQEVNYGVLPERVHVSLVEHEISAIWMHDSGAEFGQGFELYDAKTNSYASFRRDGHEITGTVREASSPAWLENATKWQEWIRENL